MAIKRINVLLNTFIAEIEEKEDKVIVKNPLTVQIVPNPTNPQAQPQPMLLPLDIMSPTITLEIPKDHVYMIEDVEPALVKVYEQVVAEITLASKGLSIHSNFDDKLNMSDSLEVTQTPKGRVKKLIN